MVWFLRYFHGWVSIKGVGSWIESHLLILEDESMFNHVRFLEMSLFVFVSFFLFLFFFFLIWVLGMWTNICLIFLENEINNFFFYKKIKENIELFFYRLGQNDMVYIKTTLFWDELVFDGELINGYEQKDILPNDR